MNRVIARFLDGRLVKGTTLNFDPEGDHLHIKRPDEPYGEGERIRFADLKAIFFVRTFEGNPDYHPRQEFIRRPGYGHRVRVLFHDEEELLGYAYHVNDSRTGLFLLPADPQSNNIRIFVPLSAVQSVWDLDLDADFLGGRTAAPPRPKLDNLHMPTHLVEGAIDEGDHLQWSETA